MQDSFPLMTLNDDCLDHLTSIIMDKGLGLGLIWASLNKHINSLCKHNIKVYHALIYLTERTPPKTLYYQKGGEGLLICFQLKSQSKMEGTWINPLKLSGHITTYKAHNKWVASITLRLERGRTELVYEGGNYFFDADQMNGALDSLCNYMS